ncbi:MAG: TIGR02171 family protein [Fibrobacter sp.]|nr:TIGR02171 family protein [Fibrobacter sp.]
MILFGCTDSFMDDDGSASFDDDPSYKLAEDMIKVMSLKKTVSLGTEDASAKESERPVMKVLFSYDYYIGRHEVTCGEFGSLMGAKIGFRVNCENDSLPVVNVTYYDAVLFANARSKAEGHDTAYTYKKSSFNDEGSCILLEGLSFRADVDGYRLPTEAEWVFAAKQSWNSENSWNALNSDYVSHKVCSMQNNNELGAKICDMAGNVMEWVNDWLGKFQNTTITNYVGAPDGGNLGERVLKGGSFRNNLTAINLFSRGDVYTVTSSTKADYVGFRLAYGRIPNPIWLSSDGTSAASHVQPLASSTTVKNMTKKYRTKLVFRNDETGNLAYIDYASGSLSVVEIRDTIDVYHPEISPDGKRVAFCTKSEGVSGSSSLYVRDLNEKGDNLVRLDVASAAIPRWNVLSNGDTVIVYVDDAKNNKDESAFEKSGTWQVKFSKGRFGEPTKLFNGSYHGGIAENLAVTGSSLLRARVKTEESVFENKLWYDGAQACNVSLNKDNAKQTLFLDFGGTEGREIVGKKYSAHEYLLFADSTGKLTKGIAAPKGYTFDHSEWAVGTYANDTLKNNIVVASLSNANGAHRKIVLLNADDEQMIELAEGEELWHPCLWTNAAVIDDEDLNLDSAAVYYSGDAAELLTYKMKMFWNVKDSVDFVALGSSRTSSGFVPRYFTSGSAFNMACVPNDMEVIHYFAKNYVLLHVPKLKGIIIGLDFDLWSENPGFNLSTNMGSAPGYAYDQNNDFWKTGVPKSFMTQAENALVANDMVYEIVKNEMGWVQLACNSWTTGGYNNTDIVQDTAYRQISPNYQNSLTHLEELLLDAKEKNIVVVGVVYPQSPSYRKTGAFGRHGLKRSDAEDLFKQVELLEKKYEHFHVLDENKMGNHDFEDNLAYDYDHLCADGGFEITRRIDSFVRNLNN